MKLRNVLAALALSLFASVAMADNCFNRPCEKADLPTCGAKLKGREFIVKNCVSASSCSTTASPGFAVTQVCDYNGSTWGYRVTSGPGDALLAGDADGQTIQGRTGENQARIDIGGSSSSQVAMHGTGLLHGVASVDNEGAYLYSADSGSYVYAIDSEGTVIGSTVAIRLIYGQTPPTNANDPCTAGDTIDTATFHYYCAATDTWVRVAMATWP